MSETVQAAMKEFMGKEFSAETTDEEAIAFIKQCPDKEWVSRILSGYTFIRLFGLTPYKALWGAVQSYLETKEELNEI